MKVIVENDNEKVIEKLKSMGIPELEILTEKDNTPEAIKVAKEEKYTMFLDADKQKTLLEKKDGDEAAAEFANMLIMEHADDFFKMGRGVTSRPVKVDKKKKAKNRAKNKRARASRRKNRK